MASGCRSPDGRRWRWIRDGWAANRWLFATVCTGAVVCGLCAWVGGIIMLVNHPPPIAVWLLAGAYALVEWWRRHASPNEADTDDLDVIDAGWEFEPA